MASMHDAKIITSTTAHRAHAEQKGEKSRSVDEENKFSAMFSSDFD